MTLQTFLSFINSHGLIGILKKIKNVHLSDVDMHLRFILCNIAVAVLFMHLFIPSPTSSKVTREIHYSNAMCKLIFLFAIAEGVFFLSLLDLPILLRSLRYARAFSVRSGAAEHTVSPVLFYQHRLMINTGILAHPHEKRKVM